MNDTPKGERVHIGLFGRRNTGKSSLLNAITGQDLAVVSPVKGTTTDPVSKAMELLPIGPVVMIDTPGIDDAGALGGLRVQKTREALRRTDVAILVAEAGRALEDEDRALLALFREMQVPFLVVRNKMDLTEIRLADGFHVSAATGENIDRLKEKIAEIGAGEETRHRLVGDLVAPGDMAVLVVPLDKAAPRGRLILPQQQVIRDLLEAGAVAVATRDTGYADALRGMAKPPAIVITDSQVFAQVSAATPEDVPLTSFSILMARYKGVLEGAAAGAKALDALADGDRVLIAEGCAHHRQCDDIGTVKLPRWIRAHAGAAPDFAFCSGSSFPRELGRYAVVVHCGGCMLNGREMRFREREARQAGVPMTNYGVAISHMQGILERVSGWLPRPSVGS
ncbi:MAG: [FeFe] hydrogenase H-cluster maturation GTPase HydF [Oscillospiraceae bacterium]|nr:[FeFe] hydrogenase H-cluster maturation GTPase HydF [Oscillospiraceae bacterium]